MPPDRYTQHLQEPFLPSKPYTLWPLCLEDWVASTPWAALRGCGQGRPPSRMPHEEVAGGRESAYQHQHPRPAQPSSSAC